MVVSIPFAFFLFHPDLLNHFHAERTSCRPGGMIFLDTGEGEKYDLNGFIFGPKYYRLGFREGKNPRVRFRFPPVSLNQRTTIRDVGRIASVSVATVSRVLNSPSVVRQATRNWVLKAMKECHYVYNAVAGGLSAPRAGTPQQHVLETRLIVRRSTDKRENP
jgi:hypothetical protein